MSQYRPERLTDGHKHSKPIRTVVSQEAFKRETNAHEHTHLPDNQQITPSRNANAVSE